MKDNNSGNNTISNFFQNQNEQEKKRFNFNRNFQHIISKSHNLTNTPININIQNININNINYYNNDNNNINNEISQRKLPKIIINNNRENQNKNTQNNFFNKTTGIIGFKKGISFNSIKELSSNQINNNQQFKKIKIIKKIY